MQPPSFWTNPPETPGLKAKLLSPLGALYARATRKRLKRPAQFTAPVPVICVGNINAGGTGKTPAVMAIVQWLLAQDIAVHVVTRGFKGTLKGPIAVDPNRHTSDETGDEPLLLAAFTKVWVAKNRADGARAAVKAGAEVIVMDDGFQNPDLSKSLSIVVVDAETGFGNGRCLPAGPLREPVEAGLERADLVLSIGTREHQNRFAARWGSKIKCPHVTANLTPLPTGMDWQSMPVMAFAGIGRPEKFFNTLSGLGAELRDTISLDDHMALSASLLNRLETRARGLGAQLVTTEKDAVRLPTVFRRRVLVLPVRLTFKDRAPLDQALSDLLQDRLGKMSDLHRHAPAKANSPEAPSVGFKVPEHGGV